VAFFFLRGTNMEDNQVTSTPNYLLGQIDAKITHLLSAFAVQKEDINAANAVLHDRIDTEAQRITRLERSHWKTAGIVSLVPIVFSLGGLVLAYVQLT
jgi:hypothetical protein